MPFLLYLLFSLQQNWRRGQIRFCLEVKGMGERARGRTGDREERWPKKCIHIRINV
jgi:hypothetical protein